MSDTEEADDLELQDFEERLVSEEMEQISNNSEKVIENDGNGEGDGG